MIVCVEELLASGFVVSEVKWKEGLETLFIQSAQALAVCVGKAVQGRG